MTRFLFLLTTLASLTAHAYEPDSTYTVTAGVTHLQYTLPGPNTLDVLEVDLTDPSIVIESYKPSGLTKTTVQCAMNDGEGHRVLGGINADFFSFKTGWPVGNQVVNGTPVLGVSSTHSALGISTLGKPLIEHFSFSGTVINESGRTASIASVNTERTADAAVLYTPFRGARTGTDSAGVEYVLALLSPYWEVNDTVTFVVTSASASGNTAIPQNGAVLSAGTTAATFFTNSIGVNDTVRIIAAYTQTANELMQVIAGNGRLVRGGVNVGGTDGVAESGSKFALARHPRTFVGFNADTTKLLLCTVDGRRASSIGMTFNDMAEFLLSLNVTEAFNFDGGGSTTMVVNGRIVNTPSDASGERAVANTLQVVKRTPGPLRAQ